MTRHHEAKAERMGLTRERLAVLIDCCGKPNQVGVYHATTASGDLVLDAPFASSMLEELQALREPKGNATAEALVNNFMEVVSWQAMAQANGYAGGDPAIKMDEDDVQRAKASLLTAITARAAITDDMVERALRTWPKNGVPYVAKDQMRLALTAALGGQ